MVKSTNRTRGTIIVAMVLLQSFAHMCGLQLLKQAQVPAAARSICSLDPISVLLHFQAFKLQTDRQNEIKDLHFHSNVMCKYGP